MRIPRKIVKFFISFELNISYYFNLTRYLYGLWNLEVQCRIYKGAPVISIPSRINQIPRIGTYFFKINSIIILPSTPGSS